IWSAKFAVNGLAYLGWDISKGCLKGIGGTARRYAHYCPLRDFKAIVGSALKLAESQNGTVTKGAIIEAIEGKRLGQGRTFTEAGHDYKFTMALQYLVDRGQLQRLPQRTGRYLNYRLRRPVKEVREWAEN